MNSEMKIIRAVNIEAEDFYEDAVRLGNHAAYALPVRHRSQMTGLENIAESTFKTSDVFDYIKKQTARSSQWKRADPKHKKDPNQGFGERLKEYLEKDLRRRLDTLCEKQLEIGNTTDEEKQKRRHIHLLLMRQFIRQMVVQYEYQVSLGNKK